MVSREAEAMLAVSHPRGYACAEGHRGCALLAGKAYCRKLYCYVNPGLSRSCDARPALTPDSPSVRAYREGWDSGSIASASLGSPCSCALPGASTMSPCITARAVRVDADRSQWIMCASVTRISPRIEDGLGGIRGTASTWWRTSIHSGTKKSCAPRCRFVLRDLFIGHGFALSK